MSISTFLSRIEFPLAGWICATACLARVWVRMHRKQLVALGGSFVPVYTSSLWNANPYTLHCSFSLGHCWCCCLPHLPWQHCRRLDNSLCSFSHSTSSDITLAIQRVAIRMRAYSYSSIILGLMILATSTPPMLGFTFLVTLSGFVYGFPQGVAPAMIGNCKVHPSDQQWNWYQGFIHRWLCGSSYLFWVRMSRLKGIQVKLTMYRLIRHYNFARFIRLSPSKQEKYHAIQEAIAEGGFGVSLGWWNMKRILFCNRMCDRCSWWSG